MQNHYEILGLTQNPAPEEIKKAWRVMARRFHPDVPEGNKQKFLAAQEAWTILSDPRLKAAYDLSLKASARFRIVRPVIEPSCQCVFYTRKALDAEEAALMQEFREEVRVGFGAAEKEVSTEEILLEETSDDQPLLKSLFTIQKGRRHGVEWLKARETVREFLIPDLSHLGNDINEALRHAGILLGDLRQSHQAWLFSYTLMSVKEELVVFAEDSDEEYVRLWLWLVKTFTARGLRVPGGNSRLETVVQIHKAVSDGRRIIHLLDQFEPKIGNQRLETILKCLAEGI